MPTETLLGALLGFVLGFGLGAGLIWFLYSSKEDAARARIGKLERELAEFEARTEMLDEQLDATTTNRERLLNELRKYERDYAAVSARLSEAQKNLNDQKATFEQSRGKLSETFQALAAQTLAKTNSSFLTLAEEKFKQYRGDATADLEARRVAIATMINPVNAKLDAYQELSRKVEEARRTEMGAVSEQLRNVATAQTQLQAETSRLIHALKSPQVRGRWGEVALRKTAELAGMTAHCDFIEQETVMSSEGRLRPDMVVRMPAGRDVIVDSKVPLAGFMEALESHTDETRSAAWAKHAKHVADHVGRLSAKEYWSQFSTSPEFVVLFIPNDSFLAAAAETDPNLVENAMSKKIILATPMTFIALLRVIEFGWRQRIAVENAEDIRNLGQELSDRFAVLTEHFLKLGGSLGKSVESFNAAVASFEGRILPTARRFKTLGAAGRKEIEELQQINDRPRELAKPEQNESTTSEVSKVVKNGKRE